MLKRAGAWLLANWKPALLACAGLALLIMLWVSMLPGLAPVGAATPAAPDPALRHETQTDTPVQSGTVKTYAPEVKRKLPLPPQVQADDNKQVLGASRLPADDHPQTVTTVIDTKTGATETYVARDPLPWLAVDTSGDAGIYYGLRNGAKAFRVEARQGFIAIKAVHIGIIAGFDQPIGAMQNAPDTFIGMGAWAHW